MIANSFGGAAKTQSVTIAASDAGFSSDANCSTWTRVSAADQIQDGAVPEQSLADIEHNRTLHERRSRHNPR